MEEQKLLKRKMKAENENNQTLLISASTDLAELYIKEGRHHLAVEEYKIITNIYKSQNKMIEYAQANRGVGEAYLGLHNFEKALEHQIIYLNVAKEENSKLEQQRALATIGHIYLTWYLETQSNPEKNLNSAYKYFMKSLMVAENLSGINKLEHCDMLARLFSNLGLVKESLGDYDTALQLLNRSIAICKENDIYEQLSRGYISIASLYEKRGEYNDAIHHYNLAIDTAKKLKNNNLICAALYEKSETLIMLSDFHSAKQVLLKAYKLKTPNIQERKNIERSLKIVAAMCNIEDKLVLISNNQKERQKLYEKMGDGACKLKVYAKAIEYYKLMLECAERIGVSGRELASCYYSLAETYKDNGQFIEAIEYFEKEYELCIDLKDNLNTLSKIADTKEAGGATITEVKAVYERAFRNCRNCANLKEEKRMVNRCIEYLRRNNDHSQAFQLSQYLHTLDETSLDDSSSSDCESEDSEVKGNIGDDIDLSNITDDSDSSDIENKQSPAKEETSVGRRRNKNSIIKKNAKGESQLHTACINGSMPVVRHLVEQGHPVNIRDNSGWLPLHEASNHGHIEIVRFLLDKGAAINDRGGTHCNGITPLYDAANNGHLRIVELLLNRGASAIIRTDDGDTPLNILKQWQNRNPLYGDDLLLYNSLVKRMSEAMERAGQSTNPLSLTHNKSDVNQTLTTTQRGRLSRRSILHEQDAECRLDENIASQLSDDGASEYLEVMDTFRNRTNINSALERQPLVAKRSALISADDNMDDWLEDDMQMLKVAKKRKTSYGTELISSSRSSSIKGTTQKRSQTSPRKQTSDDFEIPDLFFDEDREDSSILIEDKMSPVQQERRMSSESGSSTGSTSGTKRKSQTSLLDAGFSRTPSFETNHSEINRRDCSSLSPFKTRANLEGRNKPRQQKLTSLRHARSVVEADSTTLISSQASLAPEREQVTCLTPAVGDLMVYVDVKIEGMVFRIPVLLSQVQTNTIGWLAEQAAAKYARKECTRPTLELETMTGALLSDDDPLSLLFPLGAMQAELVVGKVAKLNLPPLVERYKEACSHMDIEVINSLCTILEEMSITLNLKDNFYSSKNLVPLCKALNHQTNLLELDLSGNFLNSDCVIKLCSSLPTLINLSTLNLRCTGIISSYLAEIVKVLTSSTYPILQKLTTLDVSDNFLGDKCLPHISQITNYLSLICLNLSNVKFTENIFREGNENLALNLNEIQYLDLSDNELSTSDINKFIRWTTVHKLIVLNVSRNSPENQGILSNLTDELCKEQRHIELNNLNLSRCNVSENELYDFLELHSKMSLTDINVSYNARLTGISLRRLLECSSIERINLIGCEDILRYFNDCGGCDLLQGSDKFGEKLLKISANLEKYKEQVETLLETFRNKYNGCHIEKGKCWLLLSSKKPDETDKR